jgi:hypothetical protein
MNTHPAPGICLISFSWPIGRSRKKHCQQFGNVRLSASGSVHWPVKRHGWREYKNIGSVFEQLQLAHWVSATDGANKIGKVNREYAPCPGLRLNL